MSWLLDSDVLSQPAKKAGNARVIAWLEKHQDSCYTSSIVIAQLAFWVRTKRGKQRVALQRWLTDLIEAMRGRILGFNVSVAHVWAELQHQLQTSGQPMPVEDSYIAAIARRHNLTVVTGNVNDFHRPGVKVFDPFKEFDSSQGM
jgi:predicted nucleic acid-binding protein